MNYRRLDMRATRAASLMVASLMLLSVVIYSFVSAPSFDGAMMLNTARHFLETGRYGYFYNNYFPFPTQTDGLMVLLAALAYKVAGITVATSQIPSVIFVIGLAVVTTGILSTYYSGFPLPGASILVLMVPGFIDYAIGGYGEVPVLALTLAAAYLLSKDVGRQNSKTSFWSGLLMGVAMTIKFMALILVSPILVVAVAYVIYKHIPIKRFFYVIIGLILPIFAWEIFRLLQLGRKGYATWWKLQMHQVAVQSGAGRAGHGRGMAAYFENGCAHLKVLANFYHLPSSLMLIIAFAWLSLCLYYLFSRFVRKIEFGTQRCLLLDVLVLAVAGYFGWWLFIVPSHGAWLRRILDGEILLLISTLLVLLTVAPRWRELPSPVAASLYSISSLLILALVFNPGRQLYAQLGNWRATRHYAQSLMQLSREVSALPDNAHVFGVGWWQAPAIALFSDRSFYNLDHWLPQDLDRVSPFYMAYDSYAEAIARADIADVMNDSESTVLVNNEAGSLYRVIRYTGVPASLNKHDECYKFGVASRCYGIFPDGWVRPKSLFELDWPANQSLKLQIYVPETRARGADHRLSLIARVENCEPVEIGIQTGRDTVILPPPCRQSNATVSLLLSTNFMIKHVRQIDSDNRPLSFILTQASFINAAEMK